MLGPAIRPTGIPTSAPSGAPSPSPSFGPAPDVGKPQTVSPGGGPPPAPYFAPAGGGIPGGTNAPYFAPPASLPPPSIPHGGTMTGNMSGMPGRPWMRGSMPPAPGANNGLNPKPVAPVGGPVGTAPQMAVATALRGRGGYG